MIFLYLLVQPTCVCLMVHVVVTVISLFWYVLNVQLLTGCLEEKYERKMFLFISLFQKKYEFIDFIDSWKEVKIMNNKMLRVHFHLYIIEELLPQGKLVSPKTNMNHWMDQQLSTSNSRVVNLKTWAWIEFIKSSIGCVSIYCVGGYKISTW